MRLMAVVKAHVEAKKAATAATAKVVDALQKEMRENGADLEALLVLMERVREIVGEHSAALFPGAAEGTAGAAHAKVA